MHDAMSRGDETALRKLLRRPAQYGTQRVLVGRAVAQVLVEKRGARGVARPEADAMPDTIERASAIEALPRRPVIARKERELDARQAGVEDEDGVADHSTRLV